MSDTAVDLKELGRPPRWKDGLDRSFVHGSTHHLKGKEGVEASGWRRPGAIGSRCRVVVSWGT